jgi:RNA polymerase subunit RPABC4/transcription elongation factor Spt4
LIIIKNINKIVINMKRACKICKRIISAGHICPACKSGDTTTSFQGTVVVFDTENSEIAKKLSISENGKYAIKV